MTRSAAGGALKVLLMGGYDPLYPRYRVLRRGLDLAGVDLIEKPLPLASTVTPYHLRSLAHYWFAVCRRWPLLAQACARQDYDVLLLGFPAFYDAPVARMLGARRHCPLVYDPLISLYDTYAFNKSVGRLAAIKRLLLFGYDRIPLYLVQRIWVDTPANAAYWSRLFRLPADRLGAVYLGADDTLFYPRPERPASRDLQVLFYAHLSQMHGAEVILGAAALLRQEAGIQFTLVTNAAALEAVARREGLFGQLDNVRVIDVGTQGHIPYESLPELIATCDVCLGAFGTTAKATNSVGHKEWEAWAMAKPLVTRRRGEWSPLVHGRNALLVEAGNAPALAAALRELRDDPDLRVTIARGGYETYREIGAPAAIGQKAREELSGCYASYHTRSATAGAITSG